MPVNVAAMQIWFVITLLVSFLLALHTSTSTKNSYCAEKDLVQSPIQFA